MRIDNFKLQKYKIILYIIIFFEDQPHGDQQSLPTDRSLRFTPIIKHSFIAILKR